MTRSLSCSELPTAAGRVGGSFSWMIPRNLLPAPKLLSVNVVVFLVPFQDLLQSKASRSLRRTRLFLINGKKKKKHFKESIFVLECWIMNTWNAG